MILTCVWLAKVINSKQFLIAASQKLAPISRELYTLDDVLVWEALKLIT